MGEPSTSEYVIVADLLGSLRSRCSIEAIDTNPELCFKIKELEKEVCGKFHEFVVEGLSVKVIDSEELSKKILIAAKKIDGDPYIISLDRSYFPDAKHLDPTTEYRSGRVVAHYSKPSLETQATEIMKDLAPLSLLRGGGKNGAILVDVGIDSGTTLGVVIPILEQREIKIEGVVVGIISPRFKPYPEVFGYKAVAVEPANWSVWVDSRDIFLIDGRQIPSNAGVDRYEKKFVPFIDDVENASSSGIKREKMTELRSLCFEANSRLLGVLREFGVSTDTIGTPIASRLVDSSARRRKTF
jgi:hypothetical protein